MIFHSAENDLSTYRQQITAVLHPSYMKPGHKKLSGLHHFFHIKILIYPDTRCVNA